MQSTDRLNPGINSGFFLDGGTQPVAEVEGLITPQIDRGQQSIFRWTYFRVDHGNQTDDFIVVV